MKLQCYFHGTVFHSCISEAYSSLGSHRVLRVRTVLRNVMSLLQLKSVCSPDSSSGKVFQSGQILSA